MESIIKFILASWTGNVLLVLLCVAGASLEANAQCTPQRYVDDIFGVTVDQNIQYGNAPALLFPWSNQHFTFNKSLQLDLYMPSGDTLTNRPCIVMAFGGSFLGGSKTQAELVDFCEQMAAKGYVVASIDYRIGFNVLSTNAAIRAVYRATQDMNAAVRFMRHNATTYGIDSDMVFAGGNSAGSIAALHSAYVDEIERMNSSLFEPTYGGFAFLNWPDLDCISCSGNAHPESGEVTGVVNLWGGIGDESWLLNTNLPSDIPGIVSVHGGNDEVVFHDAGNPFNYPIFPSLFGSTNIHNALSDSGVPELYSFDPNGEHELWDDQTTADAIVDLVANFLNEEYLAPTTNGGFLGPDNACWQNGTYTYLATANNNLENCWEIEGGTILSTTTNRVTVAWDNVSTGKLHLRQRASNDAWSNQISKIVDLHNCDCMSYEFTSGDPFPLGDFEAGQTIEFKSPDTIKAKNVVNPNADITYNATIEVVLNGGFQAKVGAIFEIKLDGCL